MDFICTTPPKSTATATRRTRTAVHLEPHLLVGPPPAPTLCHTSTCLRPVSTSVHHSPLAPADARSAFAPRTPHPSHPLLTRTSHRAQDRHAKRVRRVDEQDNHTVDKGSAAVKGYEEEGGKHEQRQRRVALVGVTSNPPKSPEFSHRVDQKQDQHMSREAEERDVIGFPKKEVVDGGGRAESKERERAEAEAGQEASREASRMDLIGIGAPAKVEQRKGNDPYAYGERKGMGHGAVSKSGGRELSGRGIGGASGVRVGRGGAARDEIAPRTHIVRGEMVVDVLWMGSTEPGTGSIGDEQMRRELDPGHRAAHVVAEAWGWEKGGAGLDGEKSSSAAPPHDAGDDCG
ncbi:hypothetical protein K438DRAFT_1773151 [Mycena galopus ATCC 62051]|nr:hypothetical protein K438DRAFT_1773151 [Mycena galopus ATCC 62051]